MIHYARLPGRDTVSCLDDNLMHALVEGSATLADRRRAEVHLRRCAECRELLETLGGLPDEAEEDPLIGQVLGGTYRVLRTLGSGGMGTVYVAEHQRLRRKVAVKVLRDAVRLHPEAVQRFKHEALICGMLGNRHIVSVFDFDEPPDGAPYLVMELLEGEDLAQRVALDGPVPPASMVEIMRQVCAALACAHEEGVVHRDLKPSNVFLCHEEDEPGPLVKVLDFGASKAKGLLVTLTAPEEVLGTPSYMSPEMATARHAEVDHRSDLYSLGVLAYEALCGRRPFDARSIPEMVRQTLAVDPPPPCTVNPAIPQPLSELVMHLMRKDKAGRPESARLVGRQLAQLQLDR
jgi:serine/threonine protein kinase